MVLTDDLLRRQAGEVPNASIARPLSYRRYVSCWDAVHTDTGQGASDQVSGKRPLDGLAGTVAGAVDRIQLPIAKAYRQAKSLLPAGAWGCSLARVAR